MRQITGVGFRVDTVPPQSAKPISESLAGDLSILAEGFGTNALVHLPRATVFEMVINCPGGDRCHLFLREGQEWSLLGQRNRGSERGTEESLRFTYTPRRRPIWRRCWLKRPNLTANSDYCHPQRTHSGLGCPGRRRNAIRRRARHSLFRKGRSHLGSLLVRVLEVTDQDRSVGD